MESRGSPVPPGGERGIAELFREEKYILEVVLEREPGSGSIHFSAYGCIAPIYIYKYMYIIIICFFFKKKCSDSVGLPGRRRRRIAQPSLDLYVGPSKDAKECRPVSAKPWMYFEAIFNKSCEFTPSPALGS